MTNRKGEGLAIIMAWVAFALVVIGSVFLIACLMAWLALSIWPTMPFWPVAILIFLAMAMFSRP